MSGKKASIAVILAGGAARRMGGADKGALKLNGRRLIDIVIEKLGAQADHVVISGPHNYETDLIHLPDRGDGPAGPAAGLWSALCWLESHSPGAERFLTAPVDGPFLPPDLYERLSKAKGSAIARDDAGVHPTFACWRADELRKALRDVSPGEGLSLKSLSKMAGASAITFQGDQFFRNINTPKDLAEAEADAKASGL